MAHDLWKQFSTSLDNFLKFDFEALEKIIPDTLQPWKGMNKTHLIESLVEIKGPLDFISKNKDVFEALPFNVANTLNTNVVNVFNQCTVLQRTPQQPQLNNALSHLAALRAFMYTNNINADLDRQQSLSLAEAQATRTIDSLKVASDQVSAEKLAIETLKKEVNQLIEPAVSGSLSKTFKDRAKSVRKYRYFWLIVILVFAVWTIYSTGTFVSQAMDLLLPAPGSEKPKLQIDANSDLRIVMLLIIRAGLLIPLTFLLIYAIKNAKLERQFEEEYEHKSSVATALPNYAGLISNDDVKNQILTQAADIIFQLPNQRKNRFIKEKKGNEGLDAINEIVSNITKLAKPKTE